MRENTLTSCTMYRTTVYTATAAATTTTAKIKRRRRKQISEKRKNDSVPRTLRVYTVAAKEYRKGDSVKKHVLSKLNR